MPATALASIQVKDTNNNLTYDGTIDANGNSILGPTIRPIPATAGLSIGRSIIWLGRSPGRDTTTTPLAVYATWDTRN